MGLVTTLKRTLSESESGDDEDATFDYRCAGCETEFSKPRSRMVRVTCPDCGSAAVRAVD
ncbi:hypothetical protein GCM10027435_04020 [Haloparvum alkalitolerans]|uniref:FmdB family zinc ribbon protein n=1 Tax=Haloparvum alkalitolerans TaxID=1042953 RepID=UPI003CF4D7E8